MHKTKEAIKYGLSTMNVTPKEMFSLLESSNGYDGVEYNRWLTSQIIKIAEKDGVGYSQLLGKWFNIISSIEEESSDMTFKQCWIDRLMGIVGWTSVYSIGMGEEPVVGTDVTEVADWFNAVDIRWNNVFTEEMLPSEMSREILYGSPVTFVLNMDANLPFKKSCPLAQDAKSNGIICNNAGSLLLYRMCNMMSALDDADAFRVLVVADTAFFLDKGNECIIRYFLNHFEYNDSFVVNSKDLYNSAYTNEDFAFLMCKPRNSAIQSGIVLPRLCGEGTFKDIKRYSVGGNMWKKIREGSGVVDPVEVLGYICKSASSRTSVLSSVREEGSLCIPITLQNLEDCIVYYGVTESLYNIGLPCDIPEVLSGHPKYDDLVANCIPVFLFSINSKFREVFGADGVTRKNAFDIEGSPLVQKMLDRGSQYFSYETKELIDVCKGFLDFLEQHEGGSMEGMSFEDIRAEANNEELNKAYINALNRCLDYISTQYRRM